MCAKWAVMPDPLQQMRLRERRLDLLGRFGGRPPPGGMWGTQVDTCGQTRLSRAKGRRQKGVEGEDFWEASRWA